MTSYCKDCYFENREDQEYCEDCPVYNDGSCSCSTISRPPCGFCESGKWTDIPPIEEFIKLDAELNTLWPILTSQQAINQGYKYISELVYTEYYTHKLSLKAIGVKLSLSASTISYYMKNWGWEKRACGNSKFTLTKSDSEILLAKRNTGATLRELANIFKCCPQTIRRQLKELENADL